MQKQESFYYQARAGAPTNTDAAAIGGALSYRLHCLYRAFLHEKFEKWLFLGWEMSNWLPSVEGLGVGF